MTIPGIALSIAGSDPSGGAGIQMDLKTFSVCHAWGMAVITALTAQHSGRVSGVWTMDPVVVQEQILTLLEDMTPDAIKTGMLANAGIIRAVVTSLPAGIPLIVDPVMLSTSGHRLLDEKATEAMISDLIPCALLVTPNIPEAEVLSGISIGNLSDMEVAGRIILSYGPKFVLVKGGHGSGEESVDLLITHENVVRISAPRLPYEVHGSGCCLSAAVTGYLATGMNTEEACRMGKKICGEAIKGSIMGKAGMRMVNPKVTELVHLTGIFDK
ncbi:MAG TPA: bifunctional hydroxymethylpyrimidine kinase/phosphomethylpyrimidine kinase [Methanospirillum sp.]|nr:bifunctional hydroxymethylpyrimidine kinase/phosphomethylpyrimidine kinase [Methanospirillum sp.]